MCKRLKSYLSLLSYMSYNRVLSSNDTVAAKHAMDIYEIVDRKMQPAQKLIRESKWKAKKSRIFSRPSRHFTGDLHGDDLWRIMYSTDASAYREVPVGWPVRALLEDIRVLIAFSRKHSIPLIPRTAGTSLAGQVVGKGLIVDVSRYMTEILEINREEHWVRVQPGVILDELNKVLEPLGLFFGLRPQPPAVA